MGSESLKLPNPWCLKPRNSLNESSGSGQHPSATPAPATSSTSTDRAALPAGACQVLLVPWFSQCFNRPHLSQQDRSRTCSRIRSRPEALLPSFTGQALSGRHPQGQPEVEFRDKEGLSPHSVQTLGWFRVDKVLRGHSLCLQTCDIHFWGCLK